jgi:DNA-binding response OmpR family regulator
MLTSGNADADRAAGAAKAFFPKPYRSAEVAARIRSVLAQATE